MKQAGLWTRPLEQVRGCSMEQILGWDTVDELTSRDVPLKVSFHKTSSDISKSVHPIMREKLLSSLLGEKNIFFWQILAVLLLFVSSQGKRASFHTKEMSECTWQIKHSYRLTCMFLATYWETKKTTRDFSQHHNKPGSCYQTTH